MQKISPFIWFDSNAEEAMNFYLSVFKDSKVTRAAPHPTGLDPGPKAPCWWHPSSWKGRKLC